MNGNVTSPFVGMETFGSHERQREVALPTVPAILKKRKKRVCELSDETSDTTYVNEVINELGLIGKKEPMTVNVANANRQLYVGHILA